MSTSVKRLSLLALFAITSVIGKSQMVLSDTNMQYLVKLGDMYGKSPAAVGSRVRDYSTPLLSHIVSAMYSMTLTGDNALLNREYLTRPGHNELKLWYAIQRIHRNHAGNSKEEWEEGADIVRKVLKDSIDERTLLNNYYLMIGMGMSPSLNLDMSDIDISINTFGLKDSVEKAIFFLNIQLAFTSRLILVFDNKELLKDVSHLPTFNKQPFYYYTNFNYPDFKLLAKDSLQSFNYAYLNEFIWSVWDVFSAMVKEEKKNDAVYLYFNSILVLPQYFKYSDIRKDLQDSYDKLKSSH